MFGVAGSIVTCNIVPLLKNIRREEGHQKVGAHARACGRPGTSVSIIDWHAEEVLRVLAGTSVQGTASSNLWRPVVGAAGWSGQIKT